MKTSVAMCTYNGEKFINQQLDSILNQTVSVDEIIICDDGSTDNTIKIINQYVEKYPSIIKLYVNHQNLKSVKNFEKAIKLCNNELIFLADQDDVWVEDKVEIILNYFIQNNNINCIATSGYCINEKNEKLDVFPIWDIFQEIENNKLNYDYFKIISLIGNYATGATMAFRKKFILTILPFPIIKNYHHDEWIAFHSSKKKSFHFIKNKIIHYRLHSNQQVGGVEYKNNKKDIKILIDLVDFDNQSINFSSLKMRIKRIIEVHNYKMSIYDNNITQSYNDSFLDEYKRCKKMMWKNYPIRYFFLRISDYFLGKRQLKTV